MGNMYGGNEIKLDSVYNTIGVFLEAIVRSRVESEQHPETFTLTLSPSQYNPSKYNRTVKITMEFIDP